MHPKNFQKFEAVGALFCGLAVCAGAFGAHALEGSLSQRYLDIFQVAVRYQMWHGLAILLVSVLQKLSINNKSFITQLWLFFLGTLIFSGSLFLLVLLDIPKLGAVTPLGGVLLIVGWTTLAVKLISK